MTQSTLARTGSKTLNKQAAHMSHGLPTCYMRAKSPALVKGNPEAALKTASALQAKAKETSTYSPTKNVGRIDA